jgi:hypothetical protein
MPTPRFKDLRPGEAIVVIDSFLGNQSIASFTEKLAGQNLLVEIYPDGKVIFTTKRLKGVEVNIFPKVKEVLNSFHPQVTSVTRYEFEVLKKSGRPDYIDYILPANLTVVEFSGNLTQEVAQRINSSQKDVIFYDSSFIKKPISVALSQNQRIFLEDVRTKLKDRSITKQELQQVDELLSTVLDEGGYTSSFGGRLEGLVGDVGGKKFKIPSKKYTDVQKLHSGLYGAVLKTRKKDFVSRFQSASTEGEDRLVDDTRKYLEKISTGSIDPGFRIFFSPSEAKKMLSLPNEQLGQIVYNRISSKNWVSTSDIKSESADLLRLFVKSYLL